MWLSESLYVYGYITKLCRTQAEVILNHVNPKVRSIEQGQSMQRKYKRIKLGGGQAYCPFSWLTAVSE
jgi:hypothetical protein